MINTTEILKNTVKKVVKSGYFKVTDFNTKNKTLSFINGHSQVFSLQCDPLRPDIGMLFSVGYVATWVESGLTFESDYKTMGDIEKSVFKPFLIQNTDNPDFIIRNSIAITLNRI